jgi:hypothetical protein
MQQQVNEIMKKLKTTFSNNYQTSNRSGSKRSKTRKEASLIQERNKYSLGKEKFFSINTFQRKLSQKINSMKIIAQKLKTVK